MSARSHAPLVLPLEENLADRLELVGGKAANLSAMLRAGLPVPAGFCVTTVAFELFLASCPRRAELSQMLTRRCAVTPDLAAEMSGQARAWLAPLPMPAQVEDAVLNAWRKRDAGRAWAVRSSATVEDAVGHSFAGQFESFLNVRGQAALLDAIRNCWLSLFSERALAYQARAGLSARQTAMAVVVQLMAPAEVSGVAFTADPVSGDSGQMLIEAVAGFGDRLVSGRASAEAAALDKADLRVRERRSSGQAACLDEPLLRRLGELALASERLFGRPQDLEWAAGQGQVFLLQSRPITALPEPRKAREEIWTNANVMEALPDVVTPMSWSLMQILLHEFLLPLTRRLGLPTDSAPLIDLIAGRAYMNVGALSGLVRTIGPIPIEVSAFFGGDYGPAEKLLTPPPRPRSVRSSLATLAAGIRIGLWLLPGLIRQQRVLERWRDRSFGMLAAIPPAALSDVELARRPQTFLKLACAGEGERTWASAAWMAIAGVGGGAAVFHLARRWLGDTDGSLANRLLAGAGNMDSAENGLALVRLASWAKERPAVAQALLAPGSFAEMEPRLARVDGGAEFLDRWREFMDRHGHQARGGMDVAQPRWTEMPDHILDVLRTFLRLEEAADPIQAQARRLQERARLLADCRRRLRNPFKRAVLLFLLRCSQRGLMQRENVKNEGVRMVAMVRQCLLEAGRRLRKRAILSDPNDVFFLKCSELEPVFGGSPGFDVLATVAARKAERDRFRGLQPPPVIVGRYDSSVPAATTPDPATTVLHGVAVSPGVATGAARVILQADASAQVLPGEILVAPYTDPGWTPYFLPAAGIVVDIGGLLSHGSVVAREYGLPAVVNVGAATRLIRTGDRVRVDGNAGQVVILSRARDPS